MTLPTLLKARLQLPVVASPMFIVSSPALVPPSARRALSALPRLERPRRRAT